jgi:hypothetical protein
VFCREVRPHVIDTAKWPMSVVVHNASMKIGVARRNLQRIIIAG